MEITAHISSQPSVRLPARPGRKRRTGAAGDGAPAPDFEYEHHPRWATTLTFAFSDVVAFGLVVLAAYLAATQLELFWRGADYWQLLGILPLLSAAYAFSGLYKAVLLHPAEELRRVSVITAIVAVTCVVSVLLLGRPESAVAVIALAGVLAVLLVPACRVLARVFFARADWWGCPVVVVGTGTSGRAVIRTLHRWPELGLRPVALVQEDAPRSEKGTPVINDLDQAPVLAARHDVPYAVVAMQGQDARELSVLLDHYSRYFRRVFVVPDVSSVQALWTTADSYEGLLGYGVQHYRRYRGTRVLKRTLDVAGVLLACILLAPLLLTIMALIKFDSEGSIFFRQERLGREGRCFSVFKFRTMYVDAEERLQGILDSDPERREEYQIYHKLQDDPRVTAVGTWLRRYSLDELPQLWNVLRGQMSLVGPRAYLPAELPAMNGLSRAVLQSPPGLTGLWQVSGRNGLSFEERVDMDVHYTQNWTLWLDLYILARTVPVVFTGEGAH